ncbi:hypothetical protein XELAEV_18041255mg [Xenopus laevis]|uniref:Uncharacterized protein n=1 Tax=Xenopus laevis TaxID=8355 RepID=A0A974H4Y1_XENLA|nr:hypothetical protein XELAEV_18041255mg [Xenopus laevis]
MRGVKSAVAPRSIPLHPRWGPQPRSGVKIYPNRQKDHILQMIKPMRRIPIAQATQSLSILANAILPVTYTPSAAAFSLHMPLGAVENQTWVVQSETEAGCKTVKR